MHVLDSCWGSKYTQIPLLKDGMQVDRELDVTYLALVDKIHLDVILKSLNFREMQSAENLSRAKANA